MLDTLKTASIAGLVAIGSLLPAQAESLHLGSGEHHRHGSGFAIYFGDVGHMHHPREGFYDDYRGVERRCTPERALHKAQRIGVRHARIAYVGRHEIGVLGRSHGERIRVTFARSPSCPVIG
jgi:hypothetical protein